MSESLLSQTQHRYQVAFLKTRDAYLHRQLSAEGLPESGIATCGHQAAWRCVTCHGRPTFCKDCCYAVHAKHPLHRVEFWQGAFFQPAWLRQVGVQVHCGHGGDPCPELQRYSQPNVAASTHENFGAAFQQAGGDVAEEAESEEAEPSLLIEDDASDFDDEDVAYLRQTLKDEEEAEGDSEMPVIFEDTAINVEDLPSVGEPLRQQPWSTTPTAFANDRMVVVVDTDGIQELPFTFCACPGAARPDLQLLDLGLYPASESRPTTVFTNRLLDDFLLSNKECNASARSYFNALRRRTNNAFPHMVPVRTTFLPLRKDCQTDPTPLLGSLPRASARIKAMAQSQNAKVGGVRTSSGSGSAWRPRRALSSVSSAWIKPA